MFTNVGAETCSPRSVDGEITSVIEAPVVHVGILLQGRACMLVVDATVHSHLHQVISEVETQVFADVGCLGGSFLQGCGAEDIVHIHISIGQVYIAPVAAVAVAAQITHVVVMAQVGKGVYIEVLPSSHGGVEHYGSSCVPVAVDIHGSGIACASLRVIDSGAADVVAHLCIACVYHPSALLLCHISIVEEVQVVLPAAAQATVTRADIQRVAVVCYFQQVCYAGLAHSSVESYSQLAGVAYLPSVVDAWSPVECMAYHGGVQPVFQIVHMGGLWLDAHAEVQSVLSHVISEHEVCLMIVFLVGGILAVLGIIAIVERVQSGDVAQVQLLLGVIASELGEQAVYAVHATVVVAVAVLELVAQLQIEGSYDGFRVTESCLITVGFAGRGDVLVGKVAASPLEVVDF